MFRDIRPNFGRTQVSSYACTGESIASTCLPGQMLMMMDSRPVPRLTIGREYIFLQGFPIDILSELKKGTFKENHLTDLAGNMVSVPVFLVMLMSSVASLSWLPGNIDGDPMDDEDETDCTAGPPKTDAGLLHGGPTGLAVAEGTRRRLGGQLNRVYGKVRKTSV